jgi:hypothetical protein
LPVLSLEALASPCCVQVKPVRILGVTTCNFTQKRFFVREDKNINRKMGEGMAIARMGIKFIPYGEWAARAALLCY